MRPIDSFVEIENKYDLYEKEIEGVNYWVYSRFQIFRAAMEQKNNLGTAHRVNIKGLSNKLRAGAKLIYYSYIRKCHMPERVDILVCNHPRRVIGEDGYYECCYTTDIVKHYDNSWILEYPYLYEHKVPIREKNILYTDRAKVSSNLYYQFVKRFQKMTYDRLLKKIMCDIHAPITELQKALQIELNEESIGELILKRVLICKSRRKYYERIIKKTRPKVIVEVVSYTMDCMILNELGKKYGIATVEMQHGISGSIHPAYNYGKATNIKQFPTYVFAFSDYCKKTMPFPIDSDMVKVVGYPRFENYIKNHPKPVTGKRGVCFVSSGKTGKELSQLAVELSERLDMDKWHIYYKLHPSEFAGWEEYYPWLVGTNIEVVDERGPSLYEVFSLCDAQIGIHSTALFEGLGFNLNTLIYKGYESDFYEDLCNQGHASFVQNVQECLDRLEHDDHQSITGFWKENATENVIRELDVILQNFSSGRFFNKT